MEKIMNSKTKGIGYVFLIILAATIVLSLGVGVYCTVTERSLSVVISILVPELIIILPGLIYVRRNGISLAEGIGLNKVKTGTVFKSILLGLLAIPAASFANVLSQFFVPNTMTQASGVFTDTGAVTTLLLTAVLAPVCEEIAFRGALFNGYKKHVGVIVAGIFTAVLFGLTHLNLNQLCYAFILGILFFIANEASGSVITSVIMHFVVNFINMGVLLIADAAAKSLGTDLAETAEATRTDMSMMTTMVIVYGVLAIITVALMIPVLRSIAKKEGRYDSFRAAFSKKYRKALEDREDAGEASEKENETAEVEETQKSTVLSIPVIIAIVLGMIFIFAGNAMGDFLIGIFK